MRPATRTITSLIELEGWKKMEISFPVNMKASIESGQPLNFHSEYQAKEDASYLRYSTQKGIIYLRYNNPENVNSLEYRYTGGYTSTSAIDELRKRFGLEDKMPAIYEKISTDKHMKKAVLDLHGMRVTENDPWETTLSFVISQFNNIKRIRGIVKSLVYRYGDKIETDSGTLKLFPKPEYLAAASIEELKSCGTGFRAKYIKSMAADCASSDLLSDIYKMDYDNAKETIMELDGVGDKVADCILLMGYKKLEAFPIDVWIKRSMERLYFKGRTKKIREIHDYAEGKWGEYAGYAQQYLFHGSRLKTI